MDGDDTRWLSYDELSQVRGISRASAVRLAKRRKWTRRYGNDGTTRVAVPVGEDQPKRDDTGDDAGDVTDANTGDITRTISILEVAVTTLRSQLEVANARGERAEHDRDDLRAKLAKAEEQLRQAESARVEFWSRSRFARLRSVWRGRQG